MSDAISVNLRAEFEALAGALGGSARKVLGLCRPDDFSDPSNQALMWGIEQLVSQDSEITVALVLDFLRLNSRWSSDCQVFIEHAASMANQANPEMSARLVGELAARRRLSTVLKSTADDLDSGETTSGQAAASITSQIFQIAAPGSAESRPISEIALEMHRELDRLAAGAIIGYSTSLPTVDQMIMGVQKTETMIITGPMGSCKSLLGEDMLLHNVTVGEKRCAAYILEMSATQWLKRAITRLSNKIKDAKQLRGSMQEGVSSLSKEELEEAREITNQLGSLDRRLFIEDKKRSLWEIQEDMHRRVENDGTELFLVDHYHLVTTGNDNPANRVAELSKVSTSFRAFALRHNVALVGIAKMSKAGMGAAFRGEEVFGTEIDGSSSFESDASVILSLVMKKPGLLCDCSDDALRAYQIRHKKPKHETNEAITCDDCHGFIRKATKRLGWVSVPKSREGAVDHRIPLIFDGPRLRLSEIAYNA